MAMYYTRQQLQGAGRYTGKCRVGNWNEDQELAESTFKDYLKKRSQGNLKLDKCAPLPTPRPPIPSRSCLLGPISGACLTAPPGLRLARAPRVEAGVPPGPPHQWGAAHSPRSGPPPPRPATPTNPFPVAAPFLTTRERLTRRMAGGNRCMVAEGAGKIGWLTREAGAHSCFVGSRDAWTRPWRRQLWLGARGT